MKSYAEMNDLVLSRYYKGRRTLELGFFSGNHTLSFAKFAGELESIDISKASYDLAMKNLAGKMPKNLTLSVMDAAKMTFADASFDVVVATSFHEMGDAQEKILAECDRVLGRDGHAKTIIFSEPDVQSITNELFKVFDSNENHAARIALTKERIKKFAHAFGYSISELEPSISREKFESEDGLLTEMLAWWCDIKVPSTDAEAAEMKNAIKNILVRDTPEDFKNLEVNEVSWNWILEKGNGR